MVSPTVIAVNTYFQQIYCRIPSTVLMLLTVPHSPQDIDSQSYPNTSNSANLALARPYQRRLKESPAQWRAFTTYMNMPAEERTIEKTAVALGIDYSTVCRWARMHAWVRRGQEADARLLECNADLSNYARVEAISEHVTIHRTIRQAASKRLARIIPDELSVNQAARLLEQSIDGERTAFGIGDKSNTTTNVLISNNVNFDWKGQNAPAWANANPTPIQAHRPSSPLRENGDSPSGTRSDNTNPIKKYLTQGPVTDTLTPLAGEGLLREGVFNGIGVGSVSLPASAPNPASARANECEHIEVQCILNNPPTGGSSGVQESGPLSPRPAPARIRFSKNKNRNRLIDEVVKLSSGSLRGPNTKRGPKKQPKQTHSHSHSHSHSERPKPRANR